LILTSSTQLPSERKFGLLFTAIFFAMGGYGWFRSASDISVYGWLGAALVVGLITLLAPHLLRPLNKAWFLLGQLMGKIVSPLVLGIIFFVLITPIALMTRLFGRDELRIKKQSIDSYWIQRDPVGPTSDSFKNQF